MSIHDELHLAIETEDLDAIRDMIAAGVDIENLNGGTSVLRHALDVEIEGMRAGYALHVDMTVLVLAAGADPARPTGEPAESALETARRGEHWLAVELFEAWLGRPARR